MKKPIRFLDRTGKPLPDQSGCKCDACGVELMTAVVTIHGYRSPCAPAKNENIPEQVCDHYFCKPECWLAWLEGQLLTDPRWMAQIEVLDAPASMDEFIKIQLLVNRPAVWNWNGWRVEVCCIQSTIIPPVEKPDDPLDMPPPELWGKPKWHFSVNVYGRDVSNDGAVAQTLETRFMIFNPLLEGPTTRVALEQIYQAVSSFITAGEAEDSIYPYFEPNPGNEE